MSPIVILLFLIATATAPKNEWPSKGQPNPKGKLIQISPSLYL